MGMPNNHRALRAQSLALAPESASATKIWRRTSTPRKRPTVRVNGHGAKQTQHEWPERSRAKNVTRANWCGGRANLGVDGEAGPAVWTALINNTINHKTDPVPYVYVVVNKVVPQNLTLYENGVAKYVGIPVNSGAPGADTIDGSFAVFEHVRYSDMKGTNVDGSTYDDPNVPYASYFNGGDALHGFIRSSYGTPQSNGCVEMSYANAALVWALTPIGTLVTVEGPDFGTAPPPTTTTTTASTTTTTTAPPAPAPTTTTVASPAPPPPAAPATVPAAPASPGRLRPVGPWLCSWWALPWWGPWPDRGPLAGGRLGRELGRLATRRPAAPGARATLGPEATRRSATS